MASLNSFENTILSFQYLDVTKINEFMEEMSVARTSAYYSDEKQEAYHEMNIVDVRTFLSGDRGTINTSIRLGNVITKIRNSHNVASDSYF